MSDIPQITVLELASVVRQSVFLYSKREPAVEGSEFDETEDLEDIRLLEVLRTTEEKDRGE